MGKLLHLVTPDFSFKTLCQNEVDKEDLMRLRPLFNVLLGTYPLKDTCLKMGSGDLVKANDTPWVRDLMISTESSAPIGPVWTLIDCSDTEPLVANPDHLSTAATNM